ncbi:MAG: phosphotransferase family protein [Acidimicrobiales bacterium]
MVAVGEDGLAGATPSAELGPRDAAPSPTGAAPVGIRPDAVTGWLCARVEELHPPLRFTLVAGGRSNLTYRVEDAGGRSVALRRPPVSHVLPTAHDMAREHRILRALSPTPVPAPEPLALCDDEGVTGAPFYVMSFVEGLVLRDAATADAQLADMTARRVVGEHLADTLAALHAVDVDDVGLGDLAKREGYVARQLRRWSAQFEHTKEAGLADPGGVEAVGAALAARIPPQQRVSVVHGDFRLDNAVVTADGSVAAVLDWELCTLGDPMADVGTFLDYWAPPDAGEPILGRMPASVLPGFPSAADLLERYARTSGADVSSVRYFMAFGYWRLACILQGVYARYRAGAGAGDPDSVERFPETVARLAHLAAATLGTS